MGLFGRRDKRPKPRQQPNNVTDEPALDAEPLICVACGTPLGFDPEDEPNGDGPGRHLCGECNRARNFDADFEMMWWNGDL